MSSTALIAIAISTLFHTGWNLIAKRTNSTQPFFLLVTLTISIIGMAVSMAIGQEGFRLIPYVWQYAIGAGFFQSLYFLGLTFGYRTGDFTVVYPLARGLPVLIISFFDIARGQAPDMKGWVGLFAVITACLVIGWPSTKRTTKKVSLVRKIKLNQNNFLKWVFLAAIGTVGYTIFDKIAIEEATRLFDNKISYAFEYCLYEFCCTSIFFLIFFSIISIRLQSRSKLVKAKLSSHVLKALSVRTLGSVIVGGILMYTGYSLIIWAYQMSQQTSYIVALRQFSIVITVIIGSLLFHEKQLLRRTVAGLIMTLGIIIIAY